MIFILYFYLKVKINFYLRYRYIIYLNYIKIKKKIILFIDQKNLKKCRFYINFVILIYNFLPFYLI